MSQQYEAVIGLEVHVQLSTESKIFCGCRARLPKGQSVADLAPNENTCAVCTGQPGSLPVLNKRAVEYAIRAGLATGCSINLNNVFARKNYFYPDLPKGYQISQFDRPIAENGELEIQSAEGAPKKVHIQRIHMEEDAGKNLHKGDSSLVNLNRAGTPLIEVVSSPDLRSPEEAGAYLRTLYAIVTYLDICDGNLQEGNFRCDANVSIRPRGAKELGTRTEIKNVNSFRFVEKAIEYEIDRQIREVSSGGRIVQETRTYDADRKVTISMRSKEEAHDYRYFPDPDLVPVQLEQAWVDQIKGALPELPEQKKARYGKVYGLSEYDAGVLTASKSMTSFFEAAVEDLTGQGMVPREAAKPVANILTGEVARRLNEAGIDISESRLQPAHVAAVASLQTKSVISSTGAKQAIVVAMDTGDSIEAIVDREGLKQVSDLSALEPVVEKIIAAHPEQVAEYRAGKEKLIGFFVGQVMKQTGGKANPKMLQDLVKSKLSR